MIPEAVPRLKESMTPVEGMRTSRSQSSRVRRRSPPCSSPRTSATRPEKSTRSRSSAAGLARGPVDPEALFLEAAQRLGDVADAHDLDVLQPARGDLLDDRRHPGGAVLRDEHRRDAGERRVADHRAEVVRVLDAVEHDEERPASAGEPGEHLVEVARRPRAGLGDDPLVDAAAGQAVERARVDPADREPRARASSSISRRRPPRAPSASRATPTGRPERSASSTGWTP